MKTLRTGLFVLAAGLLPALAHAHTGQGSTSGFGAGWAHPWSGLDHMLAMWAIGAWAALRGGRSVWMLPLLFVGFTLAGTLAGTVGSPMPLVELAIAVSVVVLGLLLATGARLSTPVAAVLAAGFALAHGHAHGTEMSAAAGGATYLAGFVAGTATLHALGLGLAALAIRTQRSAWVRVAGGAIAVVGLVLLA